MKKMTKAKARVLLALSLVVVVLLGLLVGFGVPNVGPLSKWNGTGKAGFIKRGLDLEGGVSVTYEVSKEKNGDFSREDVDNTRKKLELRVQDFSTEATAYLEGEDRITVEIPGETDADKVIESLGKPGSLYFCTLLEEGAEPQSGHEKVKVGESTYEIWLDGTYVDQAEGLMMATDDKGTKSEPVVSLKFTSEGTSIFADMTTKFLQKTTYIIYDNEIISQPTVQSAITNGSAQITGMASLEEARDLASRINIGRLDLELDKLSHMVVGAQLGSNALTNSVIAGAIGLLLIIIFLLLVYRIPGIAAGLSLIAYIELMLLVLNAYDITLTLPGIAGILLSIGMAVDANIIIYARIREEISTGKTIKSAIKIGFDKAASAILDGNITTLIAAVILILRGSGTVKGFGLTLAVGIVLTLVEALLISKGLVWLLYNAGFKDNKFYGKERVRKSFDFIGKKVYCFAASALIAIVGIVCIVVNSNAGKGAFYYSIEFAGGTSTTVEFVDGKTYTIDDFNNTIKPALEKAIGTSNVQGQIDTATDNLIIKTPVLSDENKAKFEDTLTKEYGAKAFYETTIGDTISAETRMNAVVATVIATICMLIYIWFRFKNIRFAGSAVLALVHDVVLVVAFYAFTRTLVGTNFIACLLTLVGYSINATIVIFDRIRENRKAMNGADLKEIVNLSITQTLTRSIYTTLTTAVMIFMMFIMGVSAIQDFTLPLIFGVLIGGYSSVFLTGSMWYMFTKKKQAK